KNRCASCSSPSSTRQLAAAHHPAEDAERMGWEGSSSGSVIMSGFPRVLVADLGAWAGVGVMELWCWWWGGDDGGPRKRKAAGMSQRPFGVLLVPVKGQGECSGGRQALWMRLAKTVDTEVSSIERVDTPARHAHGYMSRPPPRATS